MDDRQGGRKDVCKSTKCAKIGNKRKTKYSRREDLMKRNERS